MRIIIPTCDKYCNILEAQKYTMDKFGGDNMDVTILGYKKPNFDLGTWKFVSLGEDKGPSNFTNDIIPFFENFNDDYFIYGNDDVVLTNKFNIDILNNITDFVKNEPNFGRIWLTQTPPSAYFGNAKNIKDFGNYQIVELDQIANYRLSLQYSIWKTSYFKKYLFKNLNPWEWEVRNDAINDGYSIFIIINNFVISIGHVMRKNEFQQNWYNSIYNDGTLNNDDINNIRNIFIKHNFNI